MKKEDKKVVADALQLAWDNLTPEFTSKEEYAQIKSAMELLDKSDDACISDAGLNELYMESYNDGFMSRGGYNSPHTSAVMTAQRGKKIAEIKRNYTI